MIRYEVNPPKVSADSKAVQRTARRIKEISKYCGAVHITENVLGRPRVSPLEIAGIASIEAPGVEITVSMRVRDRDPDQIGEFAERCSEAGVSGILAVMGDPRRDGGKDSGQKPSRALPRLRRSGLKTYLSIPAEPSGRSIDAKAAARPDGFVTQVVSSAGQVRNLLSHLPGFKIIPVLMFPSEKNAPSARMLGLEASYDFGGTLAELQELTGDVLLSSPSDYAGLLGFLSRG